MGLIKLLDRAFGGQEVAPLHQKAVYKTVTERTITNTRSSEVDYLGATILDVSLYDKNQYTEYIDGTFMELLTGDLVRFQELNKNKVEVKTMTLEEQIAIVEEIHEDFLTASDKIVKEANEIIAQTTVNEDAVKLAALGFNNATGIVQELKKSSRLNLSKEKAETVAYYSHNYPQYKYIDNTNIDRICKKYGLIFAPADRYKGEIPVKNRKDILNFDKNIIKKEDIQYARKGSSLIPYEIPAQDLKFYQELNIEHIISRDMETIQHNNFLICAPVKDIELRRNEKIENNRIVQEFPDPVVLYPVRKGYLIITAWGPEASDESVVNQKMN